MLLKAPRQWVASPLGYNVLLSLLNENAPLVDKYRGVTKKIKKKQGYTMLNKLFISSKGSHSPSPDCQKLKEIDDIEIEVTNFDKNLNTFATWVQKFGQKSHDLELAKQAEYVLVNALMFDCPWEKSDNNAGATMRIINSFNYTMDIKYDTRILEFPLCSSFKLVVIVPTETDRLDTLFSRLNTEGLAAAISSLHPVFTVNSKMVAPNIEYSSTVYIADNINSLQSGGTVMQRGTILCNEQGTFARIVTYLMSVKGESVITEWEFGSSATPFRLAIVSYDTPLLTGQFFK